MASSGPQQQERAWPFLMIEPLFYEELENNYPFLPEWIFERMPRSINTNRLNLDRNNMSGGWIFARYNGSGTFRCVRCIKNGRPVSDVMWHSAYVTVLFRGYFGRYIEEDREYGWCGSVQMKAFAQGCKQCGENMSCEIDHNQARSLARWICRWISGNFHDYPIYSHGYRGRRERKPHLTRLCEARDHKWCKYCNG